jgi:flagellar basal-body rod protein FlgG
MDLALAIARSGLEAQHQNIEIISNNLANANTPAFKRNRAVFQDLPYQVIKQPGAPTSQETNSIAGYAIGTGSKIVGNSKIYEDGSPMITNTPTDVAIKGRGFFQVQLPNGAGYAYTRNGHFTTNEQGQLTLENGYILQPPITLPQQYTNLQVSEFGAVTVVEPGSQTPQEIGQMQLADFVNPDGLEPLGGGLYLATISSGTETLGNPNDNGYGLIKQNQLEGSNVNVVEEMINLIEAQRAFEMTSKAVSAVDSMMQQLSRQT